MEKMIMEIQDHIIWDISLLPLTRKLLWEQKTLKRLQEIF